MKLSTSLLSSAFLLSALSNVTGVKLLSSKNLKESDLDSLAAVRALNKEEKKKCRPVNVDLEDYTLWSQKSGYWFERRTYEPLNRPAYNETVFEKTEVEGNEIKIKTFYVNDAQQYYDSSTITAEACTKKNKKQKNGIVSNGVGSVYSTYVGFPLDVEFYGNPHVSKNNDKLNLEVSIPLIGFYESRTVSFYNGDPYYLGFEGNFFFNANTTNTLSGFLYSAVFDDVQQYHGNGFKLDNEDSISTLLDIFNQTIAVLDDEFYNFFGLPIPEI